MEYRPVLNNGQWPDSRSVRCASTTGISKNKPKISFDPTRSIYNPDARKNSVEEDRDFKKKKFNIDDNSVIFVLVFITTKTPLCPPLVSKSERRVFSRDVLNVENCLDRPTILKTLQINTKINTSSVYVRHASHVSSTALQMFSFLDSQTAWNGFQDSTASILLLLLSYRAES